MPRAVKITLALLLSLLGLLVFVGPAGMRREGQKLLAHAAARGYLGILRALLSLGVDPRAATPEVNALHAAAWRGRADAAALLLTRGAAVDAPDARGFTALMIAASRGDDRLVRLLLAHRASVTRRNFCGTALQIARKNQRQSTAALLEQAGAAPSP